jgi:hypothetical protein
MIEKALLKKAMGYSVKENCVEYVIDEEGNKKPVREKCQTRYYPPDLSALKAYLDRNGGEGELEQMTDEELEAEKQRLLEELEQTKV